MSIINNMNISSIVLNNKSFEKAILNDKMVFQTAPKEYQLSARSHNNTMNPTRILVDDIEVLSIPLSSYETVTTTVLAGKKVTVRLTSQGSNPLTEVNSGDPNTYPYWSPDNIEWFQDTNTIYDGYVAYSFYMPSSDVDIFLKYASVVVG